MLAGAPVVSLRDQGAAAAGCLSACIIAMLLKLLSRQVVGPRAGARHFNGFKGSRLFCAAGRCKET